MMTALMIAGLMPWTAFTQAREEKLAQEVRTHFDARRPMDACRALDEIIRLKPDWEGLPDLVFLAAQRLDRARSLERGAGLEYLRHLQNHFPWKTAGPEFDHAAANLLGWSFLHVPDKAIPPDASYPFTSSYSHYGNESRETRPPSQMTLYRIDEGTARKATLAASSPEAKDEDFWKLAPRERWNRLVSFEIPPSSPSIPLDLSQPGTYILEERLEGLVKLHRLRVSPFAVVVKALAGSMIAYAFDAKSGGPVVNAKITVSSKEGERQGRTGADGLARFETRGPCSVVATWNSEIHALRIDPPAPVEDSLVYITTDRPVYRPGQEVFFKAVRRDRRQDRLHAAPPEKVRAGVKDPLGRIVYAMESAWSDAGSISGSFRLGEEPPLGGYRVVVNVPDKTESWRTEEWEPWSHYFTVAEYRKPEIQVSVTFPGDRTMLGEGVRAVVKAEYYFGGPAVDAEVEWIVSRRPFYFPSWDGRRLPPDETRLWFFRRPRNSYDFDPPEYGLEEITKGKGKTGPDGTCEFVFDASRFEKDPDLECEFTVRAAVRDLSRFEAEGKGSLRLLPASLRVEVGATRMFARPGDRLRVRARVTDPGGKPVRDRDVELMGLVAVKRPAENEPVEFEPVFQASAKSGEDGRVSFDVSPDQPGKLRLRARVKDDRGRTAVDRADLWIEGETAFDSEIGDFEVIPDRPIYEAGETARILVRSPQKGLTALLTVEGERFHEARLVRLEKSSQVLEVPILEEHAPNVIVKLCAWKGQDAFGGGAEIGIFPRRALIDVEVKANKASYRPREKAKVTVVTRIDGRPVPAEVELGVVDEPIFAIEPEQADDVRRFFHRLRESRVSAEGTVHVEDFYDSPFKERVSGVLCGATFAMALDESKAARVMAAEDKPAHIRSFFPDTLFWRAHLKTGPDGRAEAEIEMPDSLTTWRLTARAASEADRFGESRSSALSRKDVIVRIAAPRFYTERDRGTVSTIVHNDLSAPLEFKVRLEAEGLEVEGGERTVKVSPSRPERLDWKVLASRPGTAKLRARASSVIESDAMEITLPVNPHGFDQHAARAGAVKKKWEAALDLPPEALPETARLELAVSTPGLAAVIEALPSLAGYPYGCVEQTMSRFLPSVVAGQALKRLGLSNPGLEKELPSMVDQGLRRLYDFQHEDGGWGWWKHDETHPFMTAYVVYGLATARAAGFQIEEAALKAGADRLKEMAPTPFGAYALALAGAAPDLAGMEGEKPEEDLAYLVLAGRRDLAGKLPGKPPEVIHSETIRSTAAVVRALLKVDRNDPRLNPLVEWLMLRRRGAQWLSTLDTAYVVYAFTELAAEERPALFAVRVNGREARAEGGRLRVPADALRTGENRIEVTSEESQPLFASALLKYRTREEQIRPSPGHLIVARHFQRAAVADDGSRSWEDIESGSEVSLGEEIRAVVTVRAKDRAEYVMLECPIPAGTEAREDNPSAWDFWESWYVRRELRDDRVCLAAHDVEDRRKEFAFRLRPTQPGEYHVMPAYAFAMYDPDQRGTSGEFLLRVVDGGKR